MVRRILGMEFKSYKSVSMRISPAWHSALSDTSCVAGMYRTILVLKQQCPAFRILLRAHNWGQPPPLPVFSSN